MQQILSIFEHIVDKKREQREIKRMIKDALASSQEYQNLKGKADGIRLKKKQLEMAAAEPYAEKLDLLKLDIKDSQESLSDLALNQMMQGKRVDAIEREDGKFEPVVTVKFKRAA